MLRLSVNPPESYSCPSPNPTANLRKILHLRHLNLAVPFSLSDLGQWPLGKEIGDVLIIPLVKFYRIVPCLLITGL